jgi:AcrR family transcriptional regulator
MASAEILNSDTQKPAEQTWQQTKSGMTQAAILDAALDCFYRLGYANTTTEKIAKAAGVSRGAMLHHFPTRFELIKSAVQYLNRRRLEIYSEEETLVQQGAEHTRIEEGIDAVWEQYNSPDYVVFHELKVAARTDQELADVLVPELIKFRKHAREASRKVFPDLAQSEAWEHTNNLAGFLLESMAAAKTIGGPEVPEQQMLAWLKGELRRSYQDVLNKVKRSDTL